MGGAVSSGKNNHDLIDNLCKSRYIVTPSVERAMRMVDRGFFCGDSTNMFVYQDLAWKHEDIHLSAPCIYADVLEALSIKPGQSFLNIGSGSGYLSTVVGFLLGSLGINDGVEAIDSLYKFSCKYVKEFIQSEPALDVLGGFAFPSFFNANFFNMKKCNKYMFYDRIYCGFQILPQFENFILDHLAIGGILVLPIDDTLMRYLRVSQYTFAKDIISSVTFSQMIFPISEQKDFFEINSTSDRIATLQNICRHAIRSTLVNKIHQKFPYWENVDFRNLCSFLPKFDSSCYILSNLQFKQVCELDVSNKINDKEDNLKRVSYSEELFLDKQSSSTELVPKTAIKSLPRLDSKVLLQIALMEKNGDENDCESDSKDYHIFSNFRKNMPYIHSRYMQHYIKSLPICHYLKCILNYERVFSN